MRRRPRRSRLGIVTWIGFAAPPVIAWREASANDKRGFRYGNLNTRLRTCLTSLLARAVAAVLYAWCARARRTVLLLVPSHPTFPAGVRFWFMRKTFVGSY